MAGPIVPKWPSAAGSNFIMLPKATLPNFIMSTSGADLNRVRDGKSIFYIFGFARYRDAFGKRHLTLACSRVYASRVDYTKPGATGVGGLQCGEYNCADNDCLRYKASPFTTPELTQLLKYLEE